MALYNIQLKVCRRHIMQTALQSTRNGIS